MPTYRMIIKKRDKTRPVPNVGDKFIVTGVYSSTGDLLDPVWDVTLEPYECPERPRDAMSFSNDFERD